MFCNKETVSCWRTLGTIGRSTLVCYMRKASHDSHPSVIFGLCLWAFLSSSARGQQACPTPPALNAWSFSADGKRLFVLTANQNAYIFDAEALGKGEPKESSK